jgi:cytochrome P450 family 9
VSLILCNFPLLVCNGLQCISRIIGGFDLRQPMYYVRHPDLIKQIGIKDSDHFMDHREFFSPDADPLFTKSLFALTGQKWSQMRITLSPAFTSSKMRGMFSLMEECGEKLVHHIKAEANKGQSDGLEVELRAFFSRFCNDVIATCAFGIEVDSYKDKDNEFYKNSDILRNLSPVKIFAFVMLPWLMKLLKVSIIDAKSSDYFYKVLGQNFADRDRHNIVRHDMIHLLMQAKKGNLQPQKEEQSKAEGFAVVEEVLQTNNKVKWTDDELIAQCFIFFFAGLDSIGTFLPFIVYELVVNREIQEKLYQEVLATQASLDGGELNYEALNSMKYMDMVVSETLRKWSPTPVIDRLCTKDYKMEVDGHRFTIDKGQYVVVSVYGMHHDPQYWPDPHKFDPERFNEENKRNIVSGTYIPFGIGPRNCIGK